MAIRDAVEVPVSTAQGSRAMRMRAPVASHLVDVAAVSQGVCVRPVPVRRIDAATGESTIVDIPCGATLESKCPPCAERARKLRMAQCREGWHLEEEPVIGDEAASDAQVDLVLVRAQLEGALALARDNGHDDEPIRAAIEKVDGEIAAAGVRGSVIRSERPRRTRSTRRRSDAPDLPRRAVEMRTVGRTFETRDGKVFRPSIFLTLTCPSYGRVDGEGAPRDMESYDYRRQARDAIHFARLLDRFWQNARRYLGFELQYCGTLEPQRRLAPHLHVLLRGTISRADLRRIAAATYHQVWWPQADEVKYDGAHRPVWTAEERYVDPQTGLPLPTWEEALDAIPEDAEPMHVVRFGSQLRAEGVLAGSPEADRCIRYLAKYLTKSVSESIDSASPSHERHLQKLMEAFRFEPCSPRCANWLRYGVQPKDATADMESGYCKGKAHRRETLGFGGRRVLVSRKWSGKTVADHRHDQRNWVRGLLGLADDPESARFIWVPVEADDPDLAPREVRLMRAIADRSRWRAEIEAALEAAKQTEAEPAA